MDSGIDAKEICPVAVLWLSGWRVLEPRDVETTHGIASAANMVINRSRSYRPDPELGIARSRGRNTILQIRWLESGMSPGTQPSLRMCVSITPHHPRLMALITQRWIPCQANTDPKFLVKSDLQERHPPHYESNH